ncbi:uncharacterized protein KY384_006622 [Bacidia gigantensis]|uniref:uncharacterized protein n=1 Tax=Bacidia gigantensis TaxID=2732470 RepID=UPI001D042E5E|nr:uncharacterized protein KY384_006622 [Bacidia gigantensis]KAG8528933.1 hypothetical protein KY384_006622 [Bacidia gigantensis]
MSVHDSKQLLAYTPMFHSRIFNETQNFRDRHFQPLRDDSTAAELGKDPYLDGNPQTDRPLFVQFCANDPDALLEAAQYVQPYCDAVDLNLGCPQGIARRGSYGAFLQEDWGLIHTLIHKLHIELDVPVTAKIRLLESKEKTLDYAKMILSAGASIITVHGRQRDQKGHKTGLADWSVLRFLRDHLPSETVLFANGNILQRDDIQTCLDATGFDAVMSAEGNLYDPTIFASPPVSSKEDREYWYGRNGKGGYRMDAVFRRYMDIIYKYVLEKPPPAREPLALPADPQDLAVRSLDAFLEPDDDGQPPEKKRKKDREAGKPNSPNLLAMQPHLFHLLRPLVTKHTKVRDALAKCRAGDIQAFENVLKMVTVVVREGLLDYEADPAKYDETLPLDEKALKEAEICDESSLATVGRCRRPWWICQPYVRPLPKEALAKGSLTMSKQEKRKLEQEASLPKSEKAVSKSEREKMDENDGLAEREMPKQAMVAG